MPPTVCLCYVESKEPEALKRSLDTMTKYPWVKEVFVLHADQDRLPRQEGRINHVYQDYGSGFDKQPEDGGFDEVAAKNHVLRLGRSGNCDWLLIVDADEFFLPCTINQIAIAHREQLETAFFEHWHFCSPTQYLFARHATRRFRKNGVAMHDPHMRAIRAKSECWYELNANVEVRNTWPNRTIHCTPVNPGWHTVHEAPGLYHIHTRHMFGEKRQQFLNRTGDDDFSVRTIPAGIEIFPKCYLDAYEPLVDEVADLGEPANRLG
jgi:hypothetical protein